MNNVPLSGNVVKNIQHLLTTEVKNRVDNPGRQLRYVLTACLAIVGLLIIGRHDYLLFHALVELGAVAVAWSVFFLVWSARRLKIAPAFVMLGIGCMIVGALDLLHTLAYEGMGVFPGTGADLATQLWIAARFIETATLLLFLLCFNGGGLCRWGGHALTVAAVIMLGGLFVWDYFPECFNAETGLTPFKIASEYIVMGVLAGLVFLTVRKRKLMGRPLALFLSGAMLMTIVSEFCFTLYASPFGTANMIGHLFKVVSFMLIYRALIVESLERPMETLAHGLRKETERYARIIETAVDGFWMVDMQGRIRDVNAAAERMTGLPRDTLLSMRINDIEVNESVEETARHMKMVTEKGHDLFETRHRHKDGSVLDVGVSCGFLPYDNGQFIVFVRDISQRKIAEDLLRANESNYRSIVDALPDLLFRIDAELRFTDVQTSVPEMLLAPADEIVGKTAWEILPRDIARLTDEKVRATLESGEMCAYDYTLDIRGVNREFETRMVSCGIGEVLAIVRDVTEAHVASRLLRESEKRLSLAVETARLGYWLWSIDTNKIEWFGGHADLFGIDNSEFRGSLDHVQEMVHPDDREKGIANLRRSIEGNFPFDNTYRVIHPDGSVHWLNSFGPVSSDNQGNPSRIFGITRDISEFKFAEEKLRLSEARYRGIVSVLPDLLFGIDAELRFTDVQTSVPEMLLAPADEIVGKTAWEILPRDIARLTDEKVRSTLECGRMQVYHYALDMRGVTRECETRMVPCGNGEVLAIVRDVTEAREIERCLRESEERYNAIVNDQTELICRFDVKGALGFVNDAYCDYFGLPADKLIGRSLLGFVPEKDRDFVEQQFLSLTREQPVATYEHEVIDRDGQNRWMEWTYRAIFNDRGVVTAYQAVGRDIAERKTLEQSLMKASEREQIHLALELHDGLCQDLKGLEIQAALLEDGIVDNDKDLKELAADLSEGMNLAVRKAYGITQGMFPVDLGTRGFSEALLELAERMTCHGETRLLVSVQDDLSPQNQSQAHQLYRIAQEAMNNALRHSNATEIELIWRAEKGRKLLSVRDNGIGIGIKDHKAPGGLGLQVMSSRAQSINAGLTVRNREKCGTEVLVRLKNE